MRFRRSAFTDDQLEKLKPFVREVTDTFTSHFMATWQIYFPFLTCEVKCGAATLDIADRQNVHSMTIAVRGIVELYRLVKREKELHREIITLSISHDHRTVRIYGHYPVIDGIKPPSIVTRSRSLASRAKKAKTSGPRTNSLKNVYDL
jgi:hypothetical protein